MKKINLFLILSAFAVGSLSAQTATKATKATPTTAQKSLKTAEDSVSYSIGLDIAQNLIQSKLDSVLNSDAISQGIIDGMNQSNYKIHPDQARVITQNYFMKLQEKQKASENKKFEKNIEIGKKFLEENKKQAGVKVTASGLQYKVITEGKGPKPTAADQVTLHYKGTLIDGKVFDSSIDRGEPATFGVTQVIPGFSEAIQLMSVGSKYIVYIPQEIAYGERNAGAIEPFSTLIFEIEILAIPTQNVKEEVAPAPTAATATDGKADKKSKKEKTK